MLSLTQATDLRGILEDSELQGALTQFVETQRLYFLNQAMTALRNGEIDEAKKYAYYDEAYENLLAYMRDYVTRQLKAL